MLPSDNDIFLYNSDFGIFDPWIEPKSVNLELELDFFPWLNTIFLTLNRSLHITITVRKHTAFRLLDFPTENRLHSAMKRLEQPYFPRMQLVSD